MDKSDATLERMRSFVRVAERGSLSAVARELGVGQSTVTRHLRELEDAIGVPLLSRTTRRVTMTEEGAGYYRNCVQILRLVDQAGEEARSTRGAPAGTVRISCTAALGVLHVSRFILAFRIAIRKLWSISASRTIGSTLCVKGLISPFGSGHLVIARCG